MKIKVYRSDEANLRLKQEGTFSMPYINTDINESYAHESDIESNLINIHDDAEYQAVGGIGGAFTESAALAWLDMPPGERQRLLEAYFDRERGIGYNFGRLSIASCDFSASDYTYLRDNDETLSGFDISHDKQTVFPMVREAEKYGELTLFASPWSPPAFMKTNNSRIYGGHLKKEYYDMWAQYFVKYIDACKAEGIDIWGVTMQNEPRHTQMWESCLYSPEEEIEFLGRLGAALKGKNVKIFCYDHCRERVYERLKAVCESRYGAFCDGIAHHWYSGDHFGECEAAAKKFPDKLNIASEGCCAIQGQGIQPNRDLEFAERYAHDILGCFSHGVHYYCDWNLTLNEKNGPYHNRTGRGCSAETPVYCNRETGKLVFRLSYYYIGHISKFVQKGALVVSYSSYTEKLECCAFKNPDKTVALVVLNKTEENLPAYIRLSGCVYKTEMPRRSIATFIIEK